jgi:hypothetical protein
VNRKVEILKRGIRLINPEIVNLLMKERKERKERKMKKRKVCATGLNNGIFINTGLSTLGLGY